MTTKGLHDYRFKDNPEEERFAKAWADTCRIGRTLAYLLCTGDQRNPPMPDEREEQVAATVIQWLGSPVGQAWLRDLGYEKKADTVEEAKDVTVAACIDLVMNAPLKTDHMEWRMQMARHLRNLMKAKHKAPADVVDKRVIAARDMAVHAHRDQKYGDKPYSVHLDDVATLCVSYGSTAMIVAYLHDTLEDTSLTANEIEYKFGKNVRELVQVLTDMPGKNRKEKKAATYARLGAIETGSPLDVALIVKAADRLANVVACVRDKNVGLFEMYKKEQPAFETAVYRRGLTDDFMDDINELFKRGLG